MDLSRVHELLGPELFQQVNVSDLPKIDTMTLLQFWEAGSRAKLRVLVENGSLMAVLSGKYGQALREAEETRIHNSHLTPAECLQVAELPLRL